MAARGGTWISPAGVVGHRVPLQRASFSYFCARCFNEGQGKAELAALNGAGQSTSAERRHARQVLPRGVARGLREAVHGDIAGVSRSLAIAFGLLLAMVGFVVGRSGTLLRPRRASRCQSSGPGGRADDLSVSTALPGGGPVVAGELFPHPGHGGRTDRPAACPERRRCAPAGMGARPAPLRADWRLHCRLGRGWPDRVPAQCTALGGPGRGGHGAVRRGRTAGARDAARGGFAG